MKIAIVGGIASGKSEVSRIIMRLGGAVISADEVNADIIQRSDTVEWISHNIGADYVCDGKIDKALLRAALAEDEEVRLKLNQYLHPLIRAELNMLVEAAEKRLGLAFAEVPLLVTAGMENDFDAVWYVDTSLVQRRERLVKRNNISRELANSLIATQTAEESTKSKASVIIDNNGTYNKLCLTVEREYKKIAE